LGDVVGLLQGFVVHLRDVGRTLQDVVGIPPDVMDFAEERIFTRFYPSTQVGKRPRSLKSDEMGMIQKVIRDGAANGAEKGMIQKVIHDGGL
jgi:hypothetical protein